MQVRRTGRREACAAAWHSSRSTCMPGTHQCHASLCWCVAVQVPCCDSCGVAWRCWWGAGARHCWVSGDRPAAPAAPYGMSCTGSVASRGAASCTLALWLRLGQAGRPAGVRHAGLRWGGNRSTMTCTAPCVIPLHGRRHALYNAWCPIHAPTQNRIAASEVALNEAEDAARAVAEECQQLQQVRRGGRRGRWCWGPRSPSGHGTWGGWQWAHEA